MKKLKLTLLLLWTLTAMFKLGVSQNVTFTYDDTGNRLTRSLSIHKISENISSSINDSTTVFDKEFTISNENTNVTINDLLINVTPNPTLGKFKVDVSNNAQNTKVDIYLHSIQGQYIFNKNNADIRTNIDISNHEKGIYILTVVVDGRCESWRIIKQ